jgi:hypothetical protein
LFLASATTSKQNITEVKLFVIDGNELNLTYLRTFLLIGNEGCRVWESFAEEIPGYTE